MGSLVISQAKKLADTFGMIGDERELVEVLKATAFKGPVSDSQMTALLIVAGQYGLNPFTKEIYAFPDKNNGIVPVVGVDGWSRIINSHEMFDGMSFQQDDESCTCTIYRKDRSHPIQVTEYMNECRRDVGPWKSHPKRMLRHKTMIQCARLAFGFVGVYDQDEAERIAEIEINPRQNGTSAAQAARPQIIDSPERDRLIGDLEIIAREKGLDTYAKAWADLTPEQRKMVGVDDHSRLKTLAHPAIEAEVLHE